ncbi:hypothetical protein ES703_119046 [subsurface metagenome]
MTKQEKLRDDIKTILVNRYGDNWIHNKVALEIVHTLRAQGAVLKVERELPLVTSSYTLSPHGVYVRVDQEVLREQGYVATEPLIGGE